MRCVGTDEEDSEDGLPGPGLKVEIGRTWEAIGPFPSGMREHPFIASPLAAFTPSGKDTDVEFARRPFDPHDTWPSELLDGGRAGWKRFKEDDNGWVNVSYPEVRWKQLRSDHGWAALQYSSILRTTLSVPSVPHQATTTVKIDVIQAVEYAFIPVDREPELPIIWYQADIYAFGHTSTGSRGAPEHSNSYFARTLEFIPGKYTLLVKAINEIRLFGDPGENAPVIQFKVQAEAVEDVPAIELVPGLSVVPDIYAGYLMGEWVAVGLRAGQADVVVEHVRGQVQTEVVEVVQVGNTRILSSQTRMLAIRIKQDSPLDLSDQATWEGLKVQITVKEEDGGREHTIVWSPTLRSHAQPNRPLRITFASPSTPATGPPALISYAMVIPPTKASRSKVSTGKAPVILALHGAGVDTESELWLSNIPKTGGWAVCPTGRNEWGEDWHGGSMGDSWAAREALSGVLRPLNLSASEETLLVGHSNGGQGAWHLASHYPDRVIGVIAAAGYTKIQDYVPYIELTSSRYADPALMGILLSSLSPYNNDLHLSNLVHIPVLAIHGGDDRNVPPRHSRLQAGVVDMWQADRSAVKVIEVEGEDHWWDGMLQTTELDKWIEKVCSTGRRDWDTERKEGFTLTCFNPDECGGRAGIRIVELETPGRMARLDVNAPHWRSDKRGPGMDLRGMNIKRIEIMGWGGEKEDLVKTKEGFQREAPTAPQTGPRAYGPMIRLLSSSGPILFIVGDHPQHVALAKRLAHDLFVYHRLDSEIVPAKEALERVINDQIEGNVVVVGRPEQNVYAKWTVAQGEIPLSFPAPGIFELADRTIYENGAGLITLHPHPTRSKSLSVLIAGNDAAGMEYAARLFPIRTGVPVPDWAIVGPRIAWQGAGGLVGAGFWDGEWKWNEAMSWIDR